MNKISNLPADFPAWVQETLVRLKQPSSPYFKAMNRVTGIVTILAVVAWVLDASGVLEVLPEPWGPIVVKACALVFGAFNAQGRLTVATPAPEEPKPLLPFTEKKEIENSLINQTK